MENCDQNVVNTTLHVAADEFGRPEIKGDINQNVGKRRPRWNLWGSCDVPRSRN
jgi:hypothetical protein